MHNKEVYALSTHDEEKYKLFMHNKQMYAFFIHDEEKYT